MKRIIIKENDKMEYNYIKHLDDLKEVQIWKDKLTMMSIKQINWRSKKGTLFCIKMNF